MSNEQQIEEILWEAHSYGIRENVMSDAIRMMVMNPKMDRVNAYETAFQNLKNKD
jgi:hypothetical protein|tara:strand:- start:31 stop:195 length:165 start_codon:yes stop_codon:yes gene_type:complete